MTIARSFGVSAGSMTSPAHDETAPINRLVAGVGTSAHQETLRRCLSGVSSPAVALMQLLIETEDAASVRAIVDTVTSRAATLSRATDSLLRDRVDELTQLLVENEPGCERIAQMLRANVDSPEPARSVEEGIAFCEKLFDWSVQQSEEASVALYSLGNVELLDRATQEIITQLELWNIISPKQVILDIGCGIGRITSELAPRVQQVHGTDVSSKMIDVAGRRCALLGNVTLTKGSGRDLSQYTDASIDAAIAVDTFPYLNQSGAELVAAYFREVRRVLRPDGDLVILNYSYSGDDMADAADVRRLAREHGFVVMVCGTRPFSLWDGSAFHLRVSS